MLMPPFGGMDIDEGDAVFVAYGTTIISAFPFMAVQTNSHRRNWHGTSSTLPAFVTGGTFGTARYMTLMGKNERSFRIGQGERFSGVRVAHGALSIIVDLIVAFAAEIHIGKISITGAEARIDRQVAGIAVDFILCDMLLVREDNSVQGRIRHSPQEVTISAGRQQCRYDESSDQNPLHLSLLSAPSEKSFANRKKSRPLDDCTALRRY